MAARLEITDGTTTIDLIQTGGNPFFLNHWRPSIIQPKGGGTYQQSSLSDGRRLVDRKYANARETFDITVKGDDPDALAAALHDLRVLLEKAVSYWITNYQDEPVYLIAQANCEEHERYAIIHNWSTPEDENPYSQPFQQSDQAAVMDSWTLIIERGDWLENAPGDETCVQISGTQEVAIGSDTIAYPLITNDDCYVTEGADTIALATLNILFGNMTAQPRNNGVRFRSVQVPAGATISSAFVRFTSGANSAGTTCNAIIYGERDDEPAEFSTFANFQGRTRTVNGVAWPGIAAWVQGNTYDTPDIADIIQEVINLSNWTIGDDIVIFVEDNGSDNAAFRNPASIDNVTYDEPELHITFGDRIAGRTATCELETYIANKQNVAQLSDIYIDDGGAFGPNLIGAIPPYALLPAVPLEDDAIYFGSNTAFGIWSGPFNSLVFDLSTAVEDIQCVWEYWDGAAWSSLTTQDNTMGNGSGIGDPFDTLGVRSVHWNQPDDWATTTVNTVTGYWVRARVDDDSGPVPVPPVQQNRDIYTITWAYVEVNSSQVAGDIPALLRMRLINISGSTIYAGTDRVIMGGRTVSRGESFVAHLNAANEQNPASITVAAGISCSFADEWSAPTGRVVLYSPPGAQDWSDSVTFTIDSSIAQEWSGVYHAYIIAAQVGEGIAKIAIRVRGEYATRQFTFHTGDAVYSSYYTSPNPSDIVELIDAGSIAVPSVHPLDDINLIIETRNTEAASPDDLYIYSLVLIPTDEWAGDFCRAPEDYPEVTENIGLWDYLEVDSVTYFNINVLSVIKDATLNDILLSTVGITNGRAQLQANATQRMWFVTALKDQATAPAAFWKPTFTNSHMVQFWRNQRYFSYRGAL